MSNVRRLPLAEKQPRIDPRSTPTKNTAYTNEASPRMPHHVSLKPEGNLSTRDRSSTQPALAPENKRISAVVGSVNNDPKRISQASTSSAGSVGGKRKTHIGPWQLGKTLGKGATGRVRLAKHALTGQKAAVKIVSKKQAAFVQSSSVAHLDKNDILSKSGPRSMPFGIEREVVIMKLIEHPHVINLYDIWENRGELYLIMEYVDGGELFEYVSGSGALHEVEAVRLFRQIISGLSYCHRFNICHRDLKPENILLDSELNIKLADFGMAALQPKDKMLNTSCGSPHYAAPEIIAGAPYRGDKADIWSVGIILFAMLNGFLPFDGGDLATTLKLVRRGEYYLPPTLSVEASDLIQRILQKHPQNRITMAEIWEHPLLQKHERIHATLVPPGCLAGPPPPLTKDSGNFAAMKVPDIDEEILRHLATLWHGLQRDELIGRLISEEPNHEKLFYHALVKFRADQLENYPGDKLKHSTSDYHHVKKPEPKGAKNSLKHRGLAHTRAQSQFSIISDDTRSREGYYKNPGTAISKLTQGSYDPYRASRTLLLDEKVDNTTVIIRHGSGARDKTVRGGSSQRRETGNRSQDNLKVKTDLTSDEFHEKLQQKRQTHSRTTSKSSIASYKRDAAGKKVSSRKRQVSFNHRRNQSSSAASISKLVREHARPQTARSIRAFEEPEPISQNVVAESSSTPNMPTPPHLARPRKPTSEHDMKRPRVASYYWKDDTRKVSAELGKICEEAFNRSSISSVSDNSQRFIDSPATTVSTTDTKKPTLPKDRPLPLPPIIRELTEQRRKMIETWGNADPATLKDLVATLDRRIALETEKVKVVDKRTASDPTSRPGSSQPHPSDSIGTMQDLLWNREETRSASDPTRTNSSHRLQDRTIRLVTPDPTSPISNINQLQVRKNKVMPINTSRIGVQEPLLTPSEREGYDPRLFGNKTLEPIEESPQSSHKPAAQGSPTSRKWSWLGKRTVSSHEDVPPQIPPKNTPPRGLATEGQSTHLTLSTASSKLGSQGLPSNGSETNEGLEKKQKWYQKMFTKTKAKKDGASNTHEIVEDLSDEAEHDELSIDEFDGRTSRNEQTNSNSYPPSTSVDAAAAAANGPIQISQNWFAKFLHIKPATKIFILEMSKPRARKELVKLLRDWRRYGIRDVAFEKRSGGDVVRARVDVTNYLHLKAVYFFANLYTVLEHGRKANLSIMKFTQEKGAASSFYKVVDTIEKVLIERDVIVKDAVRRKGIEASVKEAGL